MEFSFVWVALPAAGDRAHCASGHRAARPRRHVHRAGPQARGGLEEFVVGGDCEGTVTSCKYRIPSIWRDGRFRTKFQPHKRPVFRTQLPGADRDNSGVFSMSDFDRNIAAARTGYRTDQVAIDAGLRAYMIRVYNYMTAGVALTGLVAWFTFQAAGGERSTSPAIDQRLDGVRPGDLHRPADVAVRAGAARPGDASQLRHQPAFGRHGADAVFRLRRPARAVAGVDLPRLYRRVDHPRVLHLGGDVRRDEPVRLHDAARPDRPSARSCSWA